MRLSSVSSDTSIAGGGLEDMDVFTMDQSDLPKINHEDTVEELEPEYSQAVRAGRGGGEGRGGEGREGRRGEGGKEGGGREGGWVGEGGRVGWGEGGWVVEGEEGRERKGGRGRGGRERERGFTCSPNFTPQDIKDHIKHRLQVYKSYCGMLHSLVRSLSV